MNTHTRAYAVFLSLLIALFTAFPAFCEGGNGTGGGDNHDKPLVLDFAKSNIKDGEKNVDPNKIIHLYFTKNVVNFVVRENNMACFSVRDSSGSLFPITVDMGDDQVDPSDTTKRTVTIIPKRSYDAGETYTLIVKKGLAAKNGRDVLEEDVTVHFTIAGEKTTIPRYTPQYSDPSTTTTTTKAAETTAKAPRTTKPVIVAASATTATKTESVSQQTTRAAASVTSATLAQSSAVTQTVSSTFAPVANTETGRTTSENVLQTEAFTIEETTALYVAESTAETADITAETETIQTQTSVEKKRSPALFIGIIIALTAAAAAIIGIIITRKKKG